MKMPWSELEGPAKFIAICAAVFLVSGGLCGLQWVAVATINRGMNSFAGLIITTGVLELLGMLVAALGILAGIVALVIVQIRNPGKTGPQTLFDSDRDSDTQLRS